MTLESIFLICNYGVAPAWLLLALAPNWSLTERIVQQVWIPMGLGAVYLAVFLASPASPPDGNFTSLDGVMRLFASPQFALIGWVHYLAFDLFVGAWEVRDARRRSIPHLYVVPCLVLTLMAGPIGLLAYFAIRLGLRRQVELEESV